MDKPLMPSRLELATMDVIASIEAAKRTDTVQRLFQKYVKSIGFENAACLEITQGDEEPQENILMNTRPAEWTDAYFEQNHIERDPVVTEIGRSWAPFSWSDVRARRALETDEREIIDSARDFGMSAGFVVPVVEGCGYSGIVSVAGVDDDLPDETRNSLTLLSFYAHHKLRYFKAQVLKEGVPLTPREQECMNWVAAGKSDWQIGQILNVSQKTVNFHVENAKRKFGVATRMQAVVSALRLGHLTK